MMERTNIRLGPLPQNGAEYGAPQPEVTNAVREAFNWLEKEGYLMRTPGQPAPDWFSFTRAGRELLATAIRFEQWEKLGPDYVKHGLPNDAFRAIGGTPQIRKWAAEWVRIKEGRASEGVSAAQNVA